MDRAYYNKTAPVIHLATWPSKQNKANWINIQAKNTFCFHTITKMTF